MASFVGFTLLASNIVTKITHPPLPGPKVYPDRPPRPRPPQDPSANIVPTPNASGNSASAGRSSEKPPRVENTPSKGADSKGGLGGLGKLGSGSTQSKTPPVQEGSVRILSASLQVDGKDLCDPSNLSWGRRQRVQGASEILLTKEDLVLCPKVESGLPPGAKLHVEFTCDGRSVQIAFGPANSPLRLPCSRVP